MKRTQKKRQLKSKSKSKTKPLYYSKRAATEEEIMNMARRYRELLPGETPLDIHDARDEIHRKMSLFLNADYIYRRLREYGTGEDYSSTDTPALIPFGPEVFPGYVPTYDTEGNVSGYVSDENSWVPEGYEGIYEYPASIDYNNPNFYLPDFNNSYMYYLDPSLPKAYTVSKNLYELDDNDLSDIIMTDYDLSNDYEQLNLEPPTVDLVLQKYSLTDKDLDDNNEMLFELYNYAKDNDGVFNYVDPNIGKFMDTFGLSPSLLFDILRDRYASQVTKHTPVVDASPQLEVDTIDAPIDSGVDTIRKNRYDDIFFTPTHNGLRKRLVGPLTRDQFMIQLDMNDVSRRTNPSYSELWNTIMDELYETLSSETLKLLLNRLQ